MVSGEGSGIKGNFLGNKRHHEPRPFYVIASCDITGTYDYEVCVFHSHDGHVHDVEINSGGSGDPSGFIQYGEYVYFRANDGTNGSELWVYDLNTHTASMVQDLYVGTNSSAPKEFLEANGKLHFIIDQGAAASICTISSPGTTPVCNAMGPTYINVNFLRTANNGLYFSNGTDSGNLYTLDEFGNATIVGSGTNCSNGLVTDGSNFYTPDGGSNVLRIRLSDNNVSTFYSGAAFPTLHGISNGYLFLDDNGELYSVDVLGGTPLQIRLNFGTPLGNRMVISHDGYTYLLEHEVNSNMDQVIQVHGNGSVFNYATSFTNSQNQLLQTNSIRDFVIINNQIVALVESPWPDTGVWVVDLKSGESHSISGKNLNANTNFAVVLD